ncbi:21225_t:CDS:2, partial [Cetraspora pellucida]
RSELLTAFTDICTVNRTFEYYNCLTDSNCYPSVFKKIYLQNQNNIEYMEQEVSDLISLSDSGSESKEHLEETIHKQKQKPSTQPNIEQMFQKMVATDPKRKASQDQKFVSMLVKDQLPASIQEDAGLIKFLAEFDPNYQLPSEKLCRKLLTDTFDAIASLITILRPFAEATELLEGSKYATISFIYGVITVIKQKLLIYNNNSNIDFDFFCDVFDDDVVYEEHYWNVPSNEDMLAALLNSQCKLLSFMSESLKNRVFKLLKAEYEKAWVLYRIEENNNSVQNHSNSLLASMFHKRCPQLEVSDYLGAQELL